MRFLISSTSWKEEIPKNKFHTNNWTVIDDTWWVRERSAEIRLNLGKFRARELVHQLWSHSAFETFNKIWGHRTFLKYPRWFRQRFWNSSSKRLSDAHSRSLKSLSCWIIMFDKNLSGPESPGWLFCNEIRSRGFMWGKRAFLKYQRWLI